MNNKITGKTTIGKITITATAIEGVFIIEPRVFGDNRGWFYEAWSRADFAAAGLDYDFKQDNRSFSAQKGTLRGIHFQNGEHAQAKLVWCGKGAVLDVAVDLRKGSPTYAQWVAVELTAESKRQFLIPRGFGHAFLTLTDDVEFCYKADNLYNFVADRSIRYNDPDIAVNWGVEELILSEKDRHAPLLKDSDCSFVY